MTEKELLLKCIKYPSTPKNLLITKYGYTLIQLQKMKDEL